MDEYIFDGSAAGLFQARISQPTASVKVLSVSRAASPSVAAGKGFEWELLGKRLDEWKKAVVEARRVVGEAEAVAAAPVREERYGGGGAGGDRRGGEGKGGYKGNKDKKQGQGQEKEGKQGEEVAA